MNVCQKNIQKRFPFNFEDNGNQMSYKQIIADTFNNYFSNIAQTIVNEIRYEGTKILVIT